MALTVEEMQTMRDDLIRKVASLTKRVTAGDRTVENDLTAAKMALDLLDKEIDAQAETPVRRYSFNQFSKG